MTNVVQEKYVNIRNLSDILSMDNTNHYISANRIVRDPSYLDKLIHWYNFCSNEDQQDLENEGLTQEMFRNISEKSNILLKIINVPYMDEIKTHKNIFIFYYKNKIDDLKKIVDDFNQIYNDCSSDKKYDKYLIDRDLGNQNYKNDFFKVENPFHFIPDAIESLQSFIQKLEHDMKKSSTKTLIFTDNFKILATINDDIKNKGLSNEEMADFEKAYSTLLLKGFALCQIKIKINEREILLYKQSEKNWINLNENEFTDANIQKYSEKRNLIKYVYDIYECCDEVDFDKLEQIYQSHSNDEAGQVLKPLVEELIPYYKTLITTKGMMKIMRDFSEYYQPLLHYGYSLHPNDLNIFPLYLKYFQLKLINPPGKTYNDLFQISLGELFSWVFCRSFIYEKKWLPKELEEVDNIDTLQQQKYYVLWYLISYANQLEISSISIYEHCLCLSLFDWIFDDDSQEVKNYEILIKTTITNALKDFLYDKDKERGKKSFQYFAYYIINVVNKAQEPLNPSELKEKLSQLSQNAMNGRDIEGSAGGCCTIQ